MSRYSSAYNVTVFSFKLDFFVIHTYSRDYGSVCKSLKENIR